MKPSEVKSEKMGEWDKWQIESWARSIMEAEEVKADPEKMKYVLPMLKDKVKGFEAVKKSISSIEDLRKVAKEESSEEMEEEMEDESE